ncbi:hypothetical protein MMC25_006416 [Agyrium rufum]|nr:hypothetical protein [Agyrium rufum]
MEMKKTPSAGEADADAPPQGDVVVAVAGQNKHDTLKYHLLGPSLTKAGQDSVDQQKVSEIIYTASKGSKFFNNEENKDKILTQKIERILARKKELEKLDLASDRRKADEYIAELELSRDLSQVIVHIDCDAFYASVAELEHPELKDVPMAVGKGVVLAANYPARRFGIRSAMPTYIAEKLCKTLVSVSADFSKYTEKAQEVREILADYDPRFESASIDEAYLNISTYCREKDMGPAETVAQLRREVQEKCSITISAGIAPNAKIAKIASNKNKPNGQFQVASDRVTVLAFMRDLPTRKVNGVGRVFERELDAIGVKTCGDIYAHRAYLPKLFGEKAFQFLMQCFLGLGRTNVQPAEEFTRKSVGTETTFREISEKQALRDKLRWVADELEKDLLRTQFKGRTLVLKIKLHTYEVFTRQVAPPKAVSAADDLYKYALPMLEKLEKDMSGLRLRLMGLRCTHLISTKKSRTNFFGIKQQPQHSRELPSTERPQNIDDEGWEVWPEEEFEEAARQERQEEMEEMELLSQEEQREEANRRHKAGREILPNPKRDYKGDIKDTTGESSWPCPICAIHQPANDKDFNSHVDYCLSKQAIKEAVHRISPRPATPPTALSIEPEVETTRHSNGSGFKRKGRPPKNAPNRNKKLFFG